MTFIIFKIHVHIMRNDYFSGSYIVSCDENVHYHIGCKFYIKLNIYVPSTACLFVVRCFIDPRTINRRVWTKKLIHFQYNLIHYMYIHINCVSKRNTCNFTCSWLLRKKNVKEIYLIYQCICIYIILPVC